MQAAGLSCANPMQDGNFHDTCADIDATSTAVGFQPKASLAEGYRYLTQLALEGRAAARIVQPYSRAGLRYGALRAICVWA